VLSDTLTLHNYDYNFLKIIYSNQKVLGINLCPYLKKKSNLSVRSVEFFRFRRLEAGKQV